MLVLAFLLLNGALTVGSQPGNPENITVQVIDSKTVEVSWATSWKNVERYDVTYNPTENRVVSQAAGNSHSIILRELRPNTQYQVTVTAVVGGKNYRSRRLVFRTSGDPNETDLEQVHPPPTKATKLRKTYPVTPEVINPDPTAIGSKYTPQTSTTVRGVEIGLVLLALVVWIIAIALFFHRWGKIRMLLPYQPDYKTQQSLKVPGTGTTIVSSCAGNSATQGQQEGPGCVQHLRWSSRYFDEPSTAKKNSPGRWALRPRVSSAIFPASPPFFYARTSAECESPRMIRHAHSHSEFPTESIPLYQVNRPRSETPENMISITVPVIASEVNEKSQNKKTGELKVSERRKSHGNSDEERMTNIDESECPKKDKREKCYVSCVDDETSLGHYYTQSFYQSKKGADRSEWQKEKSERSPDLFFVESGDPCFQEPQPLHPEEKPRRYNRSSLKKQKIRLYDDRDLNPCKNVPIYEFEQNGQEGGRTAHESENEKTRKPKDLKTAEMRRKTFLRKISLQDTYLNYNQDYWLDYKKSLRFHKSIDLGYFGNEEKGSGKGGKKTPEGPDSIWEEPFVPRAKTNPLPQPSVTVMESQIPPHVAMAGDLRKSDSDPVIFPSKKCSCRNCGSDAVRNDSEGTLTEVIAECKGKDGGVKNSWFFLPSNENIPLFSERNGLIETDFDVLNTFEEDSPPQKVRNVFNSTGGSESTESEAKGTFLDFSNFYEIKLTNSNENLKNSTGFNFQGGEAFFASMSGDSDLFLNETEPLWLSEDGRREFSSSVHASSSPPKSSPD